jgi:hypothetical protein
MRWDQRGPGSQSQPSRVYRHAEWDDGGTKPRRCIASSRKRGPPESNETDLDGRGWVQVARCKVQGIDSARKRYGVPQQRFVEAGVPLAVIEQGARPSCTLQDSIASLLRVARRVCRCAATWSTPYKIDPTVTVFRMT